MHRCIGHRPVRHILSWLIVLLVCILTLPAMASEQTQNSLSMDGVHTIHITAEHITVDTSLSDTAELVCRYDPAQATVTSETVDGVLSLHVTGANRSLPLPLPGDATAIELRLPQAEYRTLELDASRAEIYLTPIMVDQVLRGTESMVTANLPTGYKGTIDITLNHSTGYLVIDEAATGYALSIQSTNSRISVPATFPAEDGTDTYQYTNGNGSATARVALAEESVFNVALVRRDAQ